MQETPAPIASHRDIHLAFGIGLCCAALVIATGGHYGMGWDEGYYAPTYEHVAAWIKLLLTSPGAALSADGIRAGWESINELPPVTKWLGALAMLIAPGGFELETLRLIPALCYGATFALAFLFLRRRMATDVALVGGLLYTTHPRLFGHAHFACSESPFLLLLMATILVADADSHTWRRRIALGLLAGLLVATKVNGLIALVGIGVWLLARRWVERSAAPWREDVITLGVVAGMVPLVSFAIWPWLWHDTLARVAEYARFITQHAHYGVWYLGEKWVLPPGSERTVPWHYAPVMLLVASPVLFLLAIGGGVALLARHTRRERCLPPRTLLVLLLAVGPIAAMMLPGTPRYDGLRLFLPALLPMALLGGYAISGIIARVPTVQRTRAVVLATLLLLVPFSTTLHDALGYYNTPTRLVAKGAHEFPFETTYWGESITPRVVDEILLLLDNPDARIRPMALHGAVFDIQQRWGRLPASPEFGGEPPYDAHLIQNRKGFWGNTEWWLVTHREPLATWPPDSDNPRLILVDGRPPGTF